MGVVLTWLAIFLFWGLLVFHFFWGATIKKIVEFCTLGCSLQLAITPWLLSARAVRQNPRDRILKVALAIIVWLSLTTSLFFWFVLQAVPPPHLDGWIIFVGGPIFMGTAGLIVTAFISRKMP